MNTITLIIGTAVIAFIAYNYFKKKNASYAESNDDSKLSQKQKGLLAFGAILFYYRDDKILGFDPPANLEDYKNSLNYQWEITNGTEAKATIEDLLTLKKSKEFHPLIQIESEELSSIQKRIAEELEIDIHTVKQTNSSYAWDLCRSIALAKWCYWVGYFSEEECWEYMEKAVQIARELGTGWTNYTVSFLLGRTIQGFDLDDISVNALQILTGKQPLLRKVKDLDVLQRFPFN